MSLPGYVAGLPRVSTSVTATHRIIFRQGDWLSDLAGGKIISGLYSRDTGNTGDLDVLRAGLLMGKRTSGGLYAPSIIGLSNAAYAAGATTLTLTAAAVTEITRRIGASGTFRIVGPPGAAGVIAEEEVTYSALPTTTTATITALNNSYISGSFIMANDGSQDILSVIPDGYGIKVTDTDGTTNLDVPFAQMPIAGVLISANILLWPSDASLREWLVSEMSKHGQGKFVFDHHY